MADRSPTAPRRNRIWVPFCFLTIFLMLAFTFFCTTVFGGTRSDPPPRAERPTYQLGEKWIRDDGVYELIRIEGDRYIFSAGPGHEVQLTKDLAIARMQKSSFVRTFEPPPALKWPLEVGQYGEMRGYKYLPIDRVQKLIWSVEAYELVKVPGGAFNAFRISYAIRDTSNKDP